MKFLRKQLDKIHDQVAPGGKYEKVYALYEAIDTFLYSPADVATGPTHVRDAIDLKRTMIMVVVSLIPCILMALYNTGLQSNLAIQQLLQDGTLSAGMDYGWRGDVMAALGLGFDPDNILSCFVHGALYFIPVFLVTQIAGGFWEVLFATVRRHEVNEGFLVTGMLFPLILPPTIPLWQVALGISFGVVVGKEVFGGTGKNFLNPALTARAFLYFAYAPEMSGDRVWVATPVDGYSAATTLGAVPQIDTVTVGDTGQKFVDIAGQMLTVVPGANPWDIQGDGTIVGIAANQIGVTWWDAFWGFIPGSMGETSTFACLLGALLLILTRIGSWKIMLGATIGALGSAALFNLVAPYSDNPMFTMEPHWHLVLGGLAFGIVFMATDPVSASMTNTGKWIYGLLIGVLTTLVRVINPGYPEGIMLAILLANCFAPLIDYMVLQANIKRRLARSAS